MMKRKYQKPTMQVVQLQPQAQILAGSDPKEMSGDSNNWQDLD